MFRRVKAYVSSHETWSLARSKVRYEGEKPKLSQNEEWRIKNEESTFTDFNFSFITFPRQVFVNIIDSIFLRKELCFLLHQTELMKWWFTPSIPQELLQNWKSWEFCIENLGYFIYLFPKFVSSCFIKDSSKRKPWQFMIPSYYFKKKINPQKAIMKWKQTKIKILTRLLSLLM